MVMFDDFSYRVSFVFALVLHLVLMFFLFIKFTPVKTRFGLGVSNNFINAVAISERDFNKQMNKKRLMQKKVVKKKSLSVAKKKLVAKKAVKVKKRVMAKKNDLQTALEKNLLVEQKREIEKLKKERKRYEEELAKKREREMQNILNEELLSEKKQLAKESSEIQSSIMEGHIDKYKAEVQWAIDSEWIKPDNVSDGDFCWVLIKVIPGGEVIGVELLETSNNGALERSAKAAILKASPLPVPKDIKLFNEFRVIKLFFNPEGVLR